MERAEVDDLVGLSATEVEAFRSRLKKHPSFEKVLLKARLDDVETATFAVNEYRFPGVTLEAVLHRDYPQGSLVSHVLGYVGPQPARAMIVLPHTRESAETV